MPLSREDFIRAGRGESIAIPPGTFGPAPNRNEPRTDDPDLRRAVDWLKSFMAPAEWIARRNSAFCRLYGAAFGLAAADGKGRYFDDTDTFGWYLFLADAFLDHWWNYEAAFGARVVPVLSAIGRDLDLLKSVSGVEERVRRLVNHERRQPNGGVFELLVATAYRRAGAQVSFQPEAPGIAKSHDMDVMLDGREYAVECKRLETSEYGDRERMRMRELWQPASRRAQSAERSTFGNVCFLVPLSDVPPTYLLDTLSEWLSSGLPSLLWRNAISEGVIGELDIAPLQAILDTDEVLMASTRLQELLSGRYVRHANYLQALRYETGVSPRYMRSCNLAIMLRWQSLSSAAIDGKARDVLRKLAEASRQLPDDKPSVVHIGFEALEGDEVERARHAKILASTRSFDPRGKSLRYVYCHYFVPERAFDETVQWIRLSGSDRHPLDPAFLVLPDGAVARQGAHWE